MNLESKLMLYAKPSLGKSFFQLFSTLILYFSSVYFVYKLYEINYFLALTASVLTSLLSMRLLIIQHDCSHRSFYESNLLSLITGELLMIITTTPYQWWAKDHLIHHATIGCLEKRGNGDIFTITVNEYKNKNLFEKFFYLFYRNPFVLLFFGPLYQIIRYRIPSYMFDVGWKKERNSVLRLNLYYIIILTIIFFKGNLISFMSIWIPMVSLAWFMGILLFYCQHQFENTYWSNEKNWNYKDACLKGSSYFKMNKVMQYFSANIGFHHIHHFNPRIPNYNLEMANNMLKSDFPEEFNMINQITFKDIPSLLKLRFWDENLKKLTY